MRQEFITLRKGKVDESQADEILRDVNYFGVMLVQLGLAEDGIWCYPFHSRYCSSSASNY